MAQSQPSRPPPAAAPPVGGDVNADAEFARAMRVELDRRIAELATCPDAAFGPLRAPEWAAAVALFVVLPLLLVWVMR